MSWKTVFFQAAEKNLFDLVTQIDSFDVYEVDSFSSRVVYSENQEHDRF